MQVVDADSGATVASLSIGSGVDAAAFDAQSRLVFSSQNDGTLSIIKAAGDNQHHVQQTAATLAGARAMALTSRSHDVFVVTVAFGEAPAPCASQPRPQ